MFNGIACAFTRISKLNIIKIAQVSFQLEARVFTTVIYAKQNVKNVNSKLRIAFFYMYQARGRSIIIKGFVTATPRSVLTYSLSITNDYSNLHKVESIASLGISSYSEARVTRVQFFGITRLMNTFRA